MSVHNHEDWSVNFITLKKIIIIIYVSINEAVVLVRAILVRVP